MERSAEKAKEYLESYKSVVQGRTIYVKNPPCPNYIKYDGGKDHMKMTWVAATEYADAVEEYVTCLRKELNTRTQLVTEVEQVIDSVDSVLQEIKKRKEPEATVAPVTPNISVVETPVAKKPAPNMLRR